MNTEHESPWGAALALFNGPISPGKCLPLEGHEIQPLEDSLQRYKIVSPDEEIVDVFQLRAFVSARHLADYLEWAISEGETDIESAEPLGFA